MSKHAAASQNLATDAPDRTQDAVDSVYAALTHHRANCVSCDNSQECLVGEALHDAWGETETFRDAFRKKAAR